MLAQLGKYVFKGVQSPNTLTETNSAKYAKIALVNEKDALQKTGDELGTISMSLELSIHYCDPAGMIANLKTSMQKGEKLPLIMGDGSVAGKYVISKIVVNAKRLDNNGTIESAKVELDLTESPVEEIPPVTGIALESATPVAELVERLFETNVGAAAKEIVEGAAIVHKIVEIAKDAKESIDQFKERVDEVKEMVDNAKKLYQSAKEKIEETKKIIRRTTELPRSLEELVEYLENLDRLEEITDMAELNDRLDELVESMEKVGINTAPLVAFIATKEGGEE